MRSTSKVPCPPETPDVAAFVQPFNDPILLKYFAAVRSFYGGIKFLGLGSMREKVTKDVHLDSLFVMPRLHSRHVTAAESVSDASTLEGATPLLDAVHQNQRLVVLGDPGSGKSTLIQYLSDGLCRTLDSSVRNALGALVPLPIILRELNLLGLTHAGDFDLLLKAWLGNKLRPVSAAFEGENCLLDHLLNSGQALVLIDGLDEVSDENLRHALCRAIWQGMSRYPRARWIITSRIVGYSAVEIHEHALHEVGGGITTGAKIKSAALRKEGKSEEEIAAEMEPGFSTRGERITQVASLAYVAPFNQAQIEQFARNWMLTMGDNEHDAARNTSNFIQGISERPATRLLAPTPVLLTFMGLVYRGSRDFPNGRAELFRLIVRAYVESIEKDKFGSAGIPAGLNVQIVERLLDRIGWEAQMLRVKPVKDKPKVRFSPESSNDESNNELLIAEDTLRGWMRVSLASVLPVGAVEAAIASLIRYLAERTGLIVPRGLLADASGRRQEHYAFLHLSIQEFMAARWLVERMTDDDWLDRERSRKTTEMTEDLPLDALPVLRARSHQPEWHEVFFLLHELWQKPTPLFRLFAMDPWVHLGSPHAVQSLREVIVPLKPADHTDISMERASHRWLLAAIALDESNGLAMYRDLRSQLLQALHGWVCRNWNNPGLEFSKVLLRQGDLFEMSWESLKAEHADNKPPFFIVSDCEWFNSEHLTSVCLLNDHVERLFLGSCPALTNLSSLKKLSDLHSLHLHNCGGVKDLSAIKEMKNLTMLFLNDCTGVSDLGALRGLTKIQTLNLSGCTGLSDLGFLQGLTSLRSLDLTGCTSLSDLGALTGLTSLQSLDLAGCKNVSDLSALHRLTSLTSLDLTGCTGVSDLGALQGLTNLKSLELSGCTGVNDLDAVRGLRNLQTLELSNCKGVRDLSSLQGLTDLMSINLDNCTGVTDISVLQRLSRLQTLVLFRCAGILDRRRQVAALQTALPKLRIIGPTEDYVLGN